MRLFSQFTFFEGERDEQKNISAKHHQAEKISRIFGALPDQEWTGRAAPQKSQGKKEISGLAYPLLSTDEAAPVLLLLRQGPSFFFKKALSFLCLIGRCKALHGVLVLP